jgi:hypothetical protein
LHAKGIPHCPHIHQIIHLIGFKHNRSLKVAVQGLDFMAHPLYIHTKLGLPNHSSFSSSRFMFLKN